MPRLLNLEIMREPLNWIIVPVMMAFGVAVVLILRPIIVGNQ